MFVKKTNVRASGRLLCTSAIILAMQSHGYGGGPPAACPNCPGTKATEVPAHYVGMQETCTVTQSGSLSITLINIPGASGGGPSTQGSAAASGSGSTTANCWVSVTQTDTHFIHGGNANACTKVIDDGKWYERITTASGCEKKLIGDFPGRQWVIECGDFGTPVCSPPDGNTNVRQVDCVMPLP